jgi:hypothetical protein
MQKRKGKIEEEDNRPASRWGNKAFFKRFSNLTLTALLIALTIVFTRFLRTYAISFCFLHNQF